MKNLVAVLVLASLSLVCFAETDCYFGAGSRGIIRSIELVDANNPLTFHLDEYKFIINRMEDITPEAKIFDISAYENDHFIMNGTTIVKQSPEVWTSVYGVSPSQVNISFACGYKITK
jgi:hypothetical protein